MFDAVYTETLSDLITDTLLDNEVFTEEELKTKTRAERIAAARPYIFDNYDIFDEDYRPILENKILNHFYLREIGAETPELFLYYFNRELNEQAPYFNELYRSLTFEFNPLYTVNKTVNHNATGTHTGTRTDNLSETNSASSTSSNTNHNEVSGTATATGSNTTNSSSDSKSGYNDTPQGAITGIENALTPQGSGYLTNATLTKGTGNSTVNDTSSSSNSSESDGTSSDSTNSNATRLNTGTQSNSDTNIDQYIDQVTGYEGKPVELIKEFRNNILNVDLKIIDFLKPCFMEVY